MTITISLLLTSDDNHNHNLLGWNQLLIHCIVSICYTKGIKRFRFRHIGISTFCNFLHFGFLAFQHSAISGISAFWHFCILAIFGISSFCNFWQAFPLLAISGISATSRLSMAMEILTGSLFISFHDWIGSMCMWCGVAMVLLFHSTTVALSALLCHCFSVSIDASHCLLCHMRERFDCSAF